MARFFFDVVTRAGPVEIDAEGGEFASMEQARDDAERGIADMIAESLMGGKPVEVEAILLRDESRVLIETIRPPETDAVITIEKPGEGS